MTLACLLHIASVDCSLVSLPPSAISPILLDVSEWLGSVAKPSRYIDIARYTHYFLDGTGR